MRLLRGRPPKVERLKRRVDAEGLVRALRYEDLVTDRDGNRIDLGAGIRRAATEALGGLDSREAQRGLEVAMGDPDESVRIAAVRAVCERGGPGAGESLTAAVANWTEREYARAREEALEALLALRDPLVPRRLAAGLLTREADLDEVDAEVLRQLTREGGGEALKSTIGDLIGQLGEGSARERARTLLVWLAPESVDPLIAALDDDGARVEAAAALGAIHDSRAVEPLCELLLGAGEPPARIAAARALGEIRSPAAVEPLLVATGDADYAVRAAAGASFDMLGNAGIAMAMTALARPMIENGNGHAEAQGLPEAEPAPALPEASRAPAPGLLGSRSAPVLRRLLGRPLGS